MSGENYSPCRVIVSRNKEDELPFERRVSLEVMIISWWGCSSHDKRRVNYETWIKGVCEYSSLRSLQLPQSTVTDASRRLFSGLQLWLAYLRNHFFQQYYICRAATTGGMNGGHCCYIVTVIPRNFWLVVMRLVTVAEFLRMHWRPSESSTWANEIRIPWFFLSPSSEIKLLYRSGCSINTHRPKGGVCIPGFSESVLNGPTINFPTNISTILGVPSRFLPSSP